MAKQTASERLFDAFYDCVDTGLTNIKINKNRSKNSLNWTIQILDSKGNIIEESKNWHEKYASENWILGGK